MNAVLVLALLIAITYLLIGFILWCSWEYSGNKEHIANDSNYRNSEIVQSMLQDRYTAFFIFTLLGAPLLLQVLINKLRGD